MKKILVKTTDLGIIEGDVKRALECYFDSRLFEQRKNYDEYYCNIGESYLELSINDLTILAEVVNVTVNPSSVVLETY